MNLRDYLENKKVNYEKIKHVAKTNKATPGLFATIIVDWVEKDFRNEKSLSDIERITIERLSDWIIQNEPKIKD